MSVRVKRLTLTAYLCIAMTHASIGAAQWTQWGGPDRNFIVQSADLADDWPESGPRKLWVRDLGDGYSTILVDGNRLYTQYRADALEHVVALRALTGETVWQQSNPAELDGGMRQFGGGPHSTPIVVGDRLFTVGIRMLLRCFDKNSGSVLWEHDLVKEFGAEVPGRGYSASPIAYADTVILPVGGKEAKGQSVMAFNQSNGSVAWKNQDFTPTHASPILIRHGGRDHLVVFMAEEVAGLDPKDGSLLWRHEHKTQYGANLSTPLFNGVDLIFSSAAYDSGARVIRLGTKDGKTTTEELWYSKKLRIHHGNAVRVGDCVIGSSGDFGPAFMTAIDMPTGKVAWRERGFSKATCLLAGDKLIILDEDGQLALATATPEKLTVHARCQLTERTSWSAPTLVGKTLYVRDRKRIMALDLG